MLRATRRGLNSAARSSPRSSRSRSGHTFCGAVARLIGVSALRAMVCTNSASVQGGFDDYARRCGQLTAVEQARLSARVRGTLSSIRIGELRWRDVRVDCA